MVRQNVGRNALQIGFGSKGLEIDIDLYNPVYGVAYAVGHFWGEVVPNAVTGGKTDPFKVGKGLGSNVTLYECK